MRAVLVLPILSLILALGLAAPSRAQGAPSYVQIEAHPTLPEALDRATAYEAVVSEVNGFALGRGWYGLALGPYPEAEARAVLERLRREGAIPRDSYVIRGETYGERFWPVGPRLGTVGPAAPAERGREAPPDETLREARASEARLGREARRALQRALAWFGHYEAAIDGSYGPGTRNAMAAWQGATGVEATGVLTMRQRARLLSDWRAARTALGLAPLEVPEAGLALTAPMGLVTFDRIEAPFVHYAPRDRSGVRLSLISQAGDRMALAGLYDLMRGLEIVPPEGPRRLEADGFRIEGAHAGRSAVARARLIDGHLLGYVMSWPAERTAEARRAIAEMDATLASTGPPLDPKAGFDATRQSVDMISGLELRRPIRAASGFFVGSGGTVATAAETVRGCGRVTLDEGHAARVAIVRDAVAVLRPVEPLAPMAVATLAPEPGRLRGRVAVGGFPYGGVLGAATLTHGVLEDLRGLEGEPGRLRLSLRARTGDAGGPVLESSGRVLGMLLPPDESERTLPADVALAVPAAALGEVLAEAGVTPGPAEASVTLAAEDLVSHAAEMTVLVRCWE
jgi:peptidoglycan hydrolase-like protein with peptidoglycan-binding domain